MIRAFEGFDPQIQAFEPQIEIGADLAIFLGNLAISKIWKGELALLAGQCGTYMGKMGLSASCPYFTTIIDNRHNTDPNCVTEIQTSMPDNYLRYSICLKENLDKNLQIWRRNVAESKMCGLYPNSSFITSNEDLGQQFNRMISGHYEGIKLCMKQNNITVPLCAVEIHASEICRLAHSAIDGAADTLQSLQSRLSSIHFSLYGITRVIIPFGQFAGRVLNRIFH